MEVGESKADTGLQGSYYVLSCGWSRFRRRGLKRHCRGV